MDDFEFPDSYDYSEYVEAIEQENYEGNGDGQDMSEYADDIMLGEGDFSDVFELGDEIVDDDGDYSDCEQH